MKDVIEISLDVVLLVTGLAIVSMFGYLIGRVVLFIIRSAWHGIISAAQWIMEGKLWTI
jgi:hypothetical protein